MKGRLWFRRFFVSNMLQGYKYRTLLIAPKQFCFISRNISWSEMVRIQDLRLDMFTGIEKEDKEFR